MKILLDEQLPVKLKYRLTPELEVSTVRDEQWLGFQQKLTQFKILFININQSSNRYEDILTSILMIKNWLLENGDSFELMTQKKNYLIYPQDLTE